MENITEMESERVEQGTNKKTEPEEKSQDNVMETEKEIETEEQSLDNATVYKNTVGEDDPVSQHKDSPSPMVTEEGTSHASTLETDENLPKIDDDKNSKLEISSHLSSSLAIDLEKGASNASTLEKGTNDDDDLPKTDDEKNVELETSSHLDPLSVAEDGLIKHTVEDTVEPNIGSGVVSSGVFENERDSVKDTAVIHEETTIVPQSKLSEDIGSPRHHANTVMDQEKPDMTSSEDHTETSDIKLSEDIGSPLHHADTVMEQDKTAEEHDMISSGEQKEFPVNTDTELSEEKSSPRHYADTIMEQDKTAAEHEMIPSGEHKEFLVIPDSKVLEENNDKIDEEIETNNMNLADAGSGPVHHDQGTTTEVEKGPEVPGSETVSNLEDKPSEPLIEPTVNVEKEPDMPDTENLTENDKLSDVLPAGDSDEGLSLLPAIQTSSDHNEGVATLEAEPIEDMELDVPDSKLVTDANIDSTNNNDVNVDSSNAEKKDYSSVPERSDADNESASVRREPGPPCAVSSDVKPDVGVSGGLNKIGQPPSCLDGTMGANQAAPGFDGTMSAKRSFLLEDTSEGNESGTEEDQSAFMKDLYHFFRERNMDFKPPKFYGEGLNCLKLWRAVIRLGGYDKVTGCKLWRQVGESFRPPKTCTTVSWTFRGFYEKALLEYERHKVMMGELQIPLAVEPEPMNIDNQASGSGRARRDSAARAMQGWHSQRLNGNGETNDPAVKDKNLVLHQKREKQMGNSPGLLKRKRPSSTEHAIQVSRPMLDVTVVDVGPPADWVKINVQRTEDCFEVYALVPGLVREEVRVQSDPAGRLVISGEPENPMNPWGATPFKKVVSLPTRIDPHHTSAVVTLNGQLFVRVPLEQSD
ncbi:hypothetical protein Bca52824_016501 [Brassica carinata]|uniref:AT-rich interactive domain-containing protein 3 n=1 Tax=Brassica carinata TaxID=52824 RepID=A0A8X8B6G3_BRACI|nr:hypothetical protein Bca52824_016501 [Brassica carinata]